MVTRLISAAVLAIVIFLLLLAANIAARAHHAPSGMEYETWCCNGNATHGDCAQVPAEAVEETPDGYRITLHPGDHPKVTETQVFLRGYDNVRFSTDGHFHICLWPSQRSLRCLYVPAGGV